MTPPTMPVVMRRLRHTLLAPLDIGAADAVHAGKEREPGSCKQLYDVSFFFASKPLYGIVSGISALRRARLETLTALRLRRSLIVVCLRSTGTIFSAPRARAKWRIVIDVSAGTPLVSR